MHHNKKLNLVRDKGTAPGAVSSLSADEQARYGDLADVALNQKAETTVGPAGSRAYRDHQNLKQELLDTVEQLRRERNDAAWQLSAYVLSNTVVAQWLRRRMVLRRLLRACHPNASSFNSADRRFTHREAAG